MEHKKREAVSRDAGQRPVHLVVLGAAGTGKTTIGAGLAARLGLPFGEGDDFHSQANVAKMAAGTPLTDDDRWPWLEAIAAWIAAREAEGTPSISSCSSLKRAYRDLLRKGAPRVRFVHVAGDQAVLAARLADRQGHFFPPALLASQFAALEPLQPDEDAVTVDLTLTPEAQVEAALTALGLRDAAQ